MSSDFSSSDVESSATPHAGACTSPIVPSWWSDSDGRRGSGCDGRDQDDESPWWESEDEEEKQVVCIGSPGPSPEHPHDTANISSACTSSSGTPSWWSEPSSRQQSTPCTEAETEEVTSKTCKVEPGGSVIDDDDEVGQHKLSTSSKSRKRQRDPSLNGKPVSEPPVSKLRLEPPSPHADPASVLENLKDGTYQPLKGFLLFFSVDILTRICDMTNTRCWERILEDPSIASQDGSWEEITTEEMYAFMAIVLIMRRNQDLCFGAFWREPEDAGLHWPGMLMKRSRFFTLLQVLRCSEPAADSPSGGNSASKPVAQVHPVTADIGEEETQLKEEDKIRERFECFFQQAKSVFDVFFRQCHVQCLEEIHCRDEPMNPEDLRNSVRFVVEYKDSLNQTQNYGQMNGVENSNKGGSPKITGDILRNADSDLPAKHPSQKPMSKSKITNGTSHHQPYHSNLMVMKCLDNCLTVTANSDSDLQPRLSLPLKENIKDQTGTWDEVFVPCPELVYKDCWPSDARMVDRCKDEAFTRSFFYHYLHWALDFSTSVTLKGCQPGSGRIRSETELLDAVVEGLVLLGKPDSVEQSCSDEEVDTDASSDSTTTGGESDSDVDVNDSHDEEGRHKLHRYVQARSQRGRNCALCWSLHQEERRVHTRCARCKRHFCLSRFRNCMEEAHKDQEVMKQLWDEETSDTTQDTSDVQIIESN